MPPQIELAKRDQGTRLLLLLLHAVLAPAGQSPVRLKGWTLRWCFLYRVLTLNLNLQQLYRDSSSFRYVLWYILNSIRLTFAREDLPLCNLCATRPTTRRNVVPIFSRLLLEYGFSNVYRVRWPRRPGFLFSADNVRVYGSFARVFLRSIVFRLNLFFPLNWVCFMLILVFLDLTTP